MQGLVIASLAVIGLSMTAALPFDIKDGQLHLNLRDGVENNRDPTCASDKSFVFALGGPHGLTYDDAVCNCTYMNGNTQGQEGSSLGMDWYQNKVCANMSFLDLAIGPIQRRAWEISCQCKEYDPPSESQCQFSAMPERWTRCFLFPNLEGAQYDPSFCSEIEYLNGTRSKVSAWCSIPGLYDWNG